MSVPQIKMIRIDGSLFFGRGTISARNCRAITRKHAEQAHLLIVGSGINFIDVAGCEALANEAHRLHVNGRSCTSAR